MSSTMERHRVWKTISRRVEGGDVVVGKQCPLSTGSRRIAQFTSSLQISGSVNSLL